ncbi:MAG: zinc dependent phospholipase C family protein [Spirochaetales bacterium]
MPSHISHYLFASDLVSRCLTEADAATITTAFDAFLTLGAQGPDLFLHNRRRKPSGLTYGMILHRKSAGRFCASLVHSNRLKPLISPEGAYTIGWISHVVLDRILHPYINYRAGWVIPNHPETYRYRVNHVFLERTIDVMLLRARRNMDPEAFNFASKVEVDQQQARGLFASVREALVAATKRAENDSDLGRRIRNAYLDALDYYRAIDRLDRSRARVELERSEEELPFWLGIYHPIRLPEDIDFGNRAREPWRHPCSGEIYSNESIDDMYERGLDLAEGLIGRMQESWRGARECFAGTEASLERLVGDGDLSDERLEGDPCRRTTFSVLDFPRALREIRREILATPNKKYHPR